jgi:predicted small lipoprotein YifL
MRKSVLLLTVVTMLAACGLKGPLYLPEKKPVAAAPAAVPAPDAQAGTKKNPESK